MTEWKEKIDNEIVDAKDILEKNDVTNMLEKISVTDTLEKIMKRIIKGLINENK